jgi:DnaJ-class molecular chaperone
MMTPGSMAAAAPAGARGTAAAAQVEIAPIDTLLPPTGGVDSLTAEQAAQLGTFAAALDGKDYFQLLGIPNSAAPAVIKKAFYSLSRVYHPDRFFHLTDEQSKEDINAIYKRVTEAYYVLRDDRKRKKYVSDIGGPDRAAKLRFTDASETEAKQQVKKEAEEQIGTHPKGRQFWAEAEKCLARDDIDGAGRNLKMALTFEPSNARYKEELAKVQVKLDAKWKNSGDKFKIR